MHQFKFPSELSIKCYLSVNLLFRSLVGPPDDNSPARVPVSPPVGLIFRQLRTNQKQNGDSDCNQTASHWRHLTTYIWNKR